MKATLLALVTVVCVATGTAWAHHSFAATYAEDAPPVRIEGELVQFLYRSPHSFVHVVAEDAKGQKQRWAVEWAQGGALARTGVNRDTLKPGDRVIVTGSRSRDPNEFRIRLRTIERPLDGWKWSQNFD